MSEYLDAQQLEEAKIRKVWSVSDFVRRYRLDPIEENRLTKLLGPFASEQELLMNARRSPQFR
ncbi:hypothetical protein [Rhizobium oryzicola]|uniref:Uncharacterized protein n=1 Tax=Rhizobium oryzicola TaxID=1232668 RepID=A0ABT8STL8_9HYPH|nr:hypothetical protein [Rhizobium oryzicola]MDO1581784.1 hypothetical protein [Rhizobium oryzicola]